MVQVHGAQAQQLAQTTRGVDPAQLVAVPVDVGKHTAMALVCEVTGELLARPFAFLMTMARGEAAGRAGPGGQLRPSGPAGPGRVEAAGHDHQPLVSAGGAAGGLAAGPGQPGPGGRPTAADPAGGGSRLTRWIWWRSATCCGPGTALTIAFWPWRLGNWLGGWPTGSGESRPGPP
jgi:hypothetical protein